MFPQIYVNKEDTFSQHWTQETSTCCLSIIIFITPYENVR